MKLLVLWVLGSLAFHPLAAWAQGTVLVVAPQPGGGVDFTALQSAVDAAPEGATILIQEGAYDEDVVIDGKSLTVVADEGDSVVVDGWVHVINLTAAQVVVLRGFQSIGYGTFKTALEVRDCDGAVWIEDMLGTQTGPDSCAPFHCFGTVALVKNSSSVTLAGTKLQGYSYNTDDAAALWIEDSSVAVYDCVVLGPHGGDAVTFSCTGIVPGGPGGAGVRLQGGFLLASGSTFLGGDGGKGGCCSVHCGPGGDGAPGAELVAGLSEPELVVLDSTFAGGIGGPGGGPGTCGMCTSAGSPGESYELGAGMVSEHLGEALSMTTAAPVREQGTLALEVVGPAGALAFLGIGVAPEFAYFAPLAGVLLAQGPYFFIALGAVPMTGVLHVSFPILLLPDGVESMTFYGQTAYVDSVGTVRLGAPSAVTLLDASF